MKKSILLICICLSNAVSGQNNTAGGTQALHNLSTGSNNTAIGYWSMFSGTNMSYNSAFGSWSMYYNQGNYNTAMGGSSLFYNNTGYENTGAGYRSLFNNTSGFRNLAIGVDALYSTNSYSPTQASNNTAVGYMALYNNTIGNSSVAVGAYSGMNSYSGSLNVFIGYGADYNTPTYYRSSVAVGSNAIVTLPSMIRFGDDNVMKISGHSLWHTPSDVRIKKNIKSNVPGLKFINLLEPVVYRYNLDAYRNIIKNNNSIKKDNQADSITTKAKRDKESILYTGFIAQDVESAAKSIGYDFSGVIVPKKSDETYGLRYAEFVVPMVKAVQELSIDIDSLESEIENLNDRIDHIEGIKKANSNYSQKNIVKSATKTEISKSTTPISFALQNFPNPFSNNSVITYSLPRVGFNNSILVFSNEGKILRQIKLPDGIKNGIINFKRENMHQGTYNYSLINDGKKVITKRMIIINN